jgi:hypothetical protein
VRGRKRIHDIRVNKEKRRKGEKGEKEKKGVEFPRLVSIQ